MGLCRDPSAGYARRIPFAAATMAAAYPVSTGLASEQAWVRIEEARPFVRPKPVQVVQVVRFAEILSL
jgi:hypothetical protein